MLKMTTEANFFFQEKFHFFLFGYLYFLVDSRSCVRRFLHQRSRFTLSYPRVSAEILMIFWVTSISPTVYALNVEQSESLWGCSSKPTTARRVPVRPRICPQQLMQGYLLRRFKGETQMGDSMAVNFKFSWSYAENLQPLMSVISGASELGTVLLQVVENCSLFFHIHRVLLMNVKFLVAAKIHFGWTAGNHFLGVANDADF